MVAALHQGHPLAKAPRLVAGAGSDGLVLAERPRMGGDAVVLDLPVWGGEPLDYEYVIELLGVG